MRVSSGMRWLYLSYLLVVFSARAGFLLNALELLHLTIASLLDKNGSLNWNLVGQPSRRMQHKCSNPLMNIGQNHLPVEIGNLARVSKVTAGVLALSTIAG